MSNLFEISSALVEETSGLEATPPAELTELLVRSKEVRIERIVSQGDASPAKGWYDQAENEWVAVLQGEARLLFDGDETARTMKPGDFVLIPAHQRHRVEWTTPDEPTLWLAVFYPEK